MFKDNFRAKMAKLGMSAKDVANSMEQAGYSFEAKEPHRIVQSWVAKKAYSPNVISAYAIAKALKTTVEELVDGEAGAEYVRGLFADNGLLWEPPARIADIVQVLDAIDDETLETARTMLLPLRGKKGKRCNRLGSRVMYLGLCSGGVL